jgi:glycosyltransferase involved in cell wall biosynthesis
MGRVSVLIPARNETLLGRTIQEILRASAGDVEVIAVLDGYIPDPQLIFDSRVRFIHHERSIGQRAATNEAARTATGEFIIKTDGHSMFSDGWDLALQKNCGADWTVLPRMYNLLAFNWICEKCGKAQDNCAKPKKCDKCGHTEHRYDEVFRPKTNKITDFMFIDPELRARYFDPPTLREFGIQSGPCYHKRPEAKATIADVMTGQGACWAMRKDHFFALGGLDEQHGSWGQMGVEIACKTWLSGGRQVVDKNWWFSHLFRTQPGFKFPYSISQKDIDKARAYSRDLWTNNKWPLAKRKFEWLLDRFGPVPGWKSAEQKASDLTVLYYTANKIDETFAQKVRDKIMNACQGNPIISISQKPIKMGNDNIVVGKIGRNLRNVYRQVLEGARAASTPFVALVEDDCLYVAEHFTHRPKGWAFAYNKNRWNLHVREDVYSYRDRPVLSQLIAPRDLLIECLEKRLVLETIPDELMGEPGVHDKKLGLPAYPIELFETKDPNVVICHSKGITGRKFVSERTTERIDPWGTPGEVVAMYAVPKTKPIDPTWPMIEALPDQVGPSQTPQISILIPARNEEHLQATIDDLEKHLELDYEILVGLDGYNPDPPLKDSPRVRVFRSDKSVGMRPTINRLARAARGKYLMRMDAHCSVDQGIDRKLVEVCEKGGHVTVVAQRYLLDTEKWERRPESDMPYRRLSHESEDGCGLRSLAWDDYAKGRDGIEVDETMSCSGSSWTCLRSTFVDWWGCFDERHGHFGQEGCEIACMTWLSGGRFLVHKGTWYAHQNRGKAPYAMGAHVKERSIAHSHALWVGNQWTHARLSFQWLLDKFNPPGWPKAGTPKGIPAPRQGALVKTTKTMTVENLWDHREGLSDPGKKYRLTIFWRAYASLVDSILCGGAQDGQYEQYLLGHVTRRAGRIPTRADRRKVQKSMAGSVALIESIKANGLKAPMEFYDEGGRLILWKGYRRLVIAQRLGIQTVVGRCYADRKAAGTLSPQVNLTRIESLPVNDLQKIGEKQFAAWGEEGTDKYHVHQYTRIYDAHLFQIRKRVKRVLELGLLRGASLAMWRDYFPRAEIVGADIEPEKWKKYAGSLPNSKVLVGDETDPTFIAQIVAAGPYDLIVDDASHQPEIQRWAFDQLWPALRGYGFYIIEDIYRSWKHEDTKPCIPPGLESRIYRQRDIREVHHYYNVVLIQKC